MEKALTHIKFVDLREDFEHGAHEREVGFLSVVQVFDSQSYSDLLGKLHFYQIHCELVEIHGGNLRGI
jgi:hypothetical protein